MKSQIKQGPFHFHPTVTIKKGDQDADNAILSAIDACSFSLTKLQYPKTYWFLIAGDGGYAKRLGELKPQHKIFLAFRPLDIMFSFSEHFGFRLTRLVWFKA